MLVRFNEDYFCNRVAIVNKKGEIKDFTFVECFEGDEYLAAEITNLGSWANDELNISKKEQEKWSQIIFPMGKRYWLVPVPNNIVEDISHTQN